LGERQQEELRKYKVQLPVMSVRGHNYTELGNRLDGLTLDRQIATKCKLEGVPGSFDLQLHDGTRATSQFAYDDLNHHRKESGIYMREDLLQAYLDDHDLDLVWSIWGAREGSIGNAGEYLTLDEGRGMPSGYFRTVHSHKPARKRKR